MKKLISVVLILLLIPFACMTSACNKNDLGRLKYEFQSIVSDSKHIEFKNDKLTINYSDFIKNDRAYMSELISKDSPYNNINKFNAVLDNSLTFIYSYIDLCSNGKWNVSKNLKERVFADIGDLKSAITELDKRVTDAAKSENFYESNNPNLVDLKNLYKQYVVVINKVLDVSKDIQKIYDSGILKTNMDLNDVALTDFDTSRVVNFLDYIKKTSIVDLTEVYVNSYLSSEELINSLIVYKDGGYPSINLNYDSYSANVIELKRDVVTSSAKQRADARKQEFFDASVEMSNALNALNNEYTKYLLAKGEINFADSNYDTENTVNNIYIDIIKSYNASVKNCSHLINEVLQIVS